jgi:hypothetical protein
VFGRSKQRTQSQQLLDELTRSYGHLKMAAAHVAGGTAEQVTPAYDKARYAAWRGWNTTKGAFTPLYEQVREGAANARKERQVKRNRWPVVVGIVAAGAAAGAAGAMIARRRRVAAQWDEYDPMPALDDSSYSEGRSMSSATQKVTAGAATVAESVSSQAGKLADTLHEKSRTGSSEMPSSDKTTDKAKGSFAPFDEQADNDTSPKPKPKSS